MEHLAKCACGATDKVACFHSGCKDRDVTTDHRTVGDIPAFTMHRVTAKYFEVDPPQVDYCQSCPTSANCHAAQQCLAHDFFPDGDAHDFFPDGDPVDHIADAGKMIFEVCQACDCLHKCDELGTCYKQLQRINIEEHHFNNHL